MKVIFSTLTVLVLSQNMIVAQEETKTDDYNKWSVEVNVGQNKPEKPFAPGYYSSDPTKYFNFNGVEHFDVGARYMFNPYFGAKLDFGYDILKNQSGTSSLPFETKQYRVGLQGVMNASRLLKFETFTKRFGLLIHGGLQVSQLAPQMGVNKGITEDNGGLILGLTPQFRISNRLVITGDFSYIGNIRQHFNWDGSYSDAANNLSGSLFNTSLGLTFYLGGKDTHADWYIEKSMNNTILPEKYDDKDILKRIEDLEKKNIDSDKDGVPDYKDIEPNTIAGFKVDEQGKAWDRNKNGIPDEQEGIIEKDETPNLNNSDPEYQAIVEFEYNIMYYDFDRVDPNRESRKKLIFLINYLKKHPEINIRLDGYTDSVGTIQSNNRLSQRRVQKLKSILESYNIDGNRIELKANGIDTTFTISGKGEPLARRVNIIIK